MPTFFQAFYHTLNSDQISIRYSFFIICCFVALKKGLTLKICMFCIDPLKWTFFLIVYMFRFCFRMLAVNVVSNCFSPSSKHSILLSLSFQPWLHILAQNHENPVLSNSLENPGNPDYMISDVADSIEVYLQTALVLLFWSSKSQRNPWFF